MNLKPKPKGENAFTRWECAAALLCIVLLLSVTMAALANSREAGNRAVCANNLRRLGNAVLMFSSEHSEAFPPYHTTNPWPTSLQPYYQNIHVLQCPRDNPRIPPGAPGGFLLRSYLLNGWNDYWEAKGVNITATADALSIPEADIPHPGQTILFGEKDSASSQLHMNLFQGDHQGNVEYNRHYGGAEDRLSQSAGSNFTFADGSVRFLSPPAALRPLNLWAITDRWRTNLVAFP